MAGRRRTPNPGAWLTTTANRKAIDRIRRENKRDDKQKEAQMLYDDDPPEPLGAIDDERLRLIFTCCHPALATSRCLQPAHYNITHGKINSPRT